MDRDSLDVSWHGCRQPKRIDANHAGRVRHLKVQQSALDVPWIVLEIGSPRMETIARESTATTALARRSTCQTRHGRGAGTRTRTSRFARGSKRERRHFRWPRVREHPLELSALPGASSELMKRETRSDDGRFGFYILPPGRSTLSVKQSGFQPVDALPFDLIAGELVTHTRSRCGLSCTLARSKFA